MNRTRFKEVIDKYYDIENLCIPDSDLDFINNDDYVDREFSEKINQAFSWVFMQREYTKSLANLLNRYIYNLYKLYHLDKIICQYDSRYEAELRYEFTDLVFDYCLNCPTVFCERAVYACAKLCDEANRIVRKSGFYHINNDRSINFKILEKAELVGSWSAIEELKNHLTKIGNQSDSFLRKTEDYRNRAQHRLPQSLDLGVTRNIRSSKTGLNSVIDESVFKIIKYDLRQRGLSLDIHSNECVEHKFILEDPLLIKNMIPVLIDQGKAMKKAFLQYWNLVEEQAQKILET